MARATRSVLAPTASLRPLQWNERLPFLTSTFPIPDLGFFVLAVLTLGLPLFSVPKVAAEGAGPTVAHLAVEAARSDAGVRLGGFAAAASALRLPGVRAARQRRLPRGRGRGAVCVLRHSALRHRSPHRALTRRRLLPRLKAASRRAAADKAAQARPLIGQDPRPRS